MRIRILPALRIAVAGLLALGTLSAATCGYSRERVDAEAFTWSGELKAPGTVQVRNRNGSIEVKPADDATVRVTAAARWRRGNPKRDLKFDVVTEGNVITICALWGGGTCSATRYRGGSGLLQRLVGWTTDASVAFTVFVPAGVKVDVSTLNGTVNVAATAPVVARSMNGNVNVGTAVGPVEAVTVNGSVDARMTTLGGDGPVRVSTVNGSASAYLPEKFDAEVDLSVVHGRVGSDVSVATDSERVGARHLTGSVGAGGRRVEVRTVNGTAWLHRLNADGTVRATP